MLDRMYAYLSDRKILLSVLVLAPLFLALAWQGPRFGGDTPSYLSADPVRLPVYVLLLDAFRAVAGERWTILVVLQLVAGAAGPTYLLRTLNRLFPMGAASYAVALVLLASPYFFGDYKIGNTLQTEAVTYPLFLVGVALLLRGVVERRLGMVAAFLPVLLVLLLTRKQFLFAVPALVVMLPFLWRWFSDRRGKVALVALGIAAVVMVSGAVERAYIHLRFGQAEAIPFAGVQLINAPMYFSESGDEGLFSDPLERRVFAAYHAGLADRNALHLNYNREVLADHWASHWAGAYVVSYKVMNQVAKAEGLDQFQRNAVTLSIARTLIRERPAAYLLTVFHTVKGAMGGYTMLALLLAVMGWSTWAAWTSHSRLAEVLFATTLMHFANLSAVATVEPLIRRYVIYTDNLMAALAIAMAVGLYRAYQKSVKP